MELVKYLVDIYGYDTPIFLKDIRIGRKSKSAIKEEFYRAVKSGEIERESNGIYFVRSEKEFGSGVSFNDIIESKFIYSDNCIENYKELYIEGYYSGLTFLNILHISEQVPAIREITTNKTSAKKRYFSSNGCVAIIRKGRTNITFQNYKILQFLDSFYFMSEDDIKDKKEILISYIKNNGFTKEELKRYISLYSSKTINKILNEDIFNAFK